MKKLILSLVTTGAILASAHGFAETIIQDDWVNPPDSNYSSLIGRTPDTTDLPGTNWELPLGNAYGQGVNTNADTAYLNGDNNAMVSIASGNGYIEPTILAISSAGINYGQVGDDYDVDGSDTYARGVAIGFFSTDATGNHGPDYFSGLMLTANGDLSLYSNGSYTGIHSTYVGTPTTQAAGDLSYDYNTLTGAITDVVFNGVNYSSAFAGDDVQTGDQFAGWTVSSTNGGGTGYLFNDFEVASGAATPEPATDALFALGGGLLLAGWLRSRRAKA